MPTEKGLHLIDSIKNDALLSPELTGQWEKKLNDMAQGSYDRHAFMDEIKTFTQSITQVQKATQNNGHPLGKCPLCDGNIMPTPKAYSCSNWKEKECKFAIWKTIAQKPISIDIAKTLLSKRYTDKNRI